MKFMFSALVLVIATSCVLIDARTPTAHGTTIRFQLPSRTIGADWTSVVDSYEVTLTNTDGKGFATIGPKIPSPPNSPSITIAGIEAGVWKIDVVAKSGSLTVATASLTNQSLPTASSIPIALAPSQSGMGSFTYRVTYPDNLGITGVTATLKDASTLALIASPTPSVTGPVSNLFTAEIAAAGVPSGRYRLVMSFLRGDGSVARASTEAVNIWDNVDSEAWIDGAGAPQSEQALGATDFNDSNSQLGDLTATLGGSPLVLGGGFSSATTDYTTSIVNTVNSEDLVLTATEGFAGQEILVSLDGGSSFSALATGAASAVIPIVRGTTSVLIQVHATGYADTAPNSTLATVYTLTFEKKRWELDRFVDGVWQTNSIPAPPVNVRAVAGTDSALYALGDSKIWTFDGSVWNDRYPFAPAADAQWLAADSKRGALVSAGPSGIVWFDDGGSANIPMLPVGLAGIAFDGAGTLWAAGLDGNLWQWTGSWEQGHAYPLGFTALGGGKQLLVFTASTILGFGLDWSGVASVPTALSSLTTAFHSITALVLR